MRRLTHLFALLALTGCGKSPAPAEPSSATASVTASASAQASAAPSAEPTAALLEPGCYDDATLDEEPRAALSALGRACAPGMKPALKAPAQLTLEAGRGQLKLPLSSLEQCFRAAVVAPSARAVSLTARGPSGAELSTVRLTAPFAVLSLEGPVCPGEAGEHQLTLQTEPSIATAWVQVWLGE